MKGFFQGSQYRPLIQRWVGAVEMASEDGVVKVRLRLLYHRGALLSRWQFMGDFWEMDLMFGWSLD
jgi:hypothetical protein